MQKKMLIIFIDGVGLTDPVRPPWTTARLPSLTKLCGTVPSARLHIQEPELVFQAVDTTLGVAGLPQSGTGHTTLWTGKNAPALLGRHYPGYPAASQRPLLKEFGLFKQLHTLGKTVSIATVHRDMYWQRVADRSLKATAIAYLAQAAELPLPAGSEFLAGRAVPWDITGQYLAAWGAWSAEHSITPAEAARRLIEHTKTVDLVHYECFLPDFVGHQRIAAQPEAVLELIDQFLGSLIAQRPADTSIVIISDHGNLEEPEHRRHTFNPVPLIVIGPAAGSKPYLKDISQLTPWILTTLSS